MEGILESQIEDSDVLETYSLRKSAYSDKISAKRTNTESYNHTQLIHFLKLKVKLSTPNSS